MLASSSFFLVLVAVARIAALPIADQLIKRLCQPASSLSAPSINVENGPQSTSNTISGLFPLGQTAKSWSTSPEAENTIPLSMGAMQAHVVREPKGVDNAPDGQEAIHVSFSEGAYDYKGPPGGFLFFALGDEDVDLSTAKEFTMGYRVYLQDGFQCNKGGKLPGIFGGSSLAIAETCSGGNKPDGCFSTRMMFRKDCEGELYAYFPPSFKNNLAEVCDTPPFSTCNPDYGSSIGRGSFSFARGQWTTIAQRIRLNDYGEKNGEIEIFANGGSVISLSGLTFVTSSNGAAYGIQAQMFFGGHESSWASPIDQSAWFRDFSIAILE